MPHVVERARTGRAKCRGCGKPIPAGTDRFGERLPNPFADDEAEMTHWFHPVCAAFMRPEAFLALPPDVRASLDDHDRLDREAQLGIAHRRLPRATSVGRASTGRAHCRACREAIGKETWRIALTYYEEGRFVPSGFIHLGCAAAYLESTDLIDRLRHFSPDLGDDDISAVRAELERQQPPRVL